MSWPDGLMQSTRSPIVATHDWGLLDAWI